jgi:hypothetical protein
VQDDGSADPDADDDGVADHDDGVADDDGVDADDDGVADPGDGISPNWSSNVLVTLASPRSRR